MRDSATGVTSSVSQAGGGIGKGSCIVLQLKSGRERKCSVPLLPKASAPAFEMEEARSRRWEEAVEGDEISQIPLRDS